MTRAFSLILVGLAGLGLAACELDFTSPETDLEGLPDGLVVDLEVEPAEVRQHGAFSLRLRILNTTDEPIVISTGISCLAHPHVKRGGKWMPFRGTDLACLAVGVAHVFEPGEVYERVWDLEATLYSQSPRDIEGAPAPKGKYAAGLTFGGSSLSGSFPVIERSLRVR